MSGTIPCICLFSQWKEEAAVTRPRPFSLVVKAGPPRDAVAAITSVAVVARRQMASITMSRSILDGISHNVAVDFWWHLSWRFGSFLMVSIKMSRSIPDGISHNISVDSWWHQSQRLGRFLMASVSGSVDSFWRQSQRLARFLMALIIPLRKSLKSKDGSLF